MTEFNLKRMYRSPNGTPRNNQFLDKLDQNLHRAMR